MKRYLVPDLAGVAVFGGVTAFAATLTVESTTLGSGDKVVASCNATAAVSYTTTLATGSYKVATTPITTATTCATKAFKVTLTGTSGSLIEKTGTLGADGTAAPAYTTDNITAASVTGVSVVITG